MLLEVETVHELEGAWWAFALKAARRASVSALCCAMRRHFSSGVTLVASGLSSERLTDLEWGMGHALVPARAVLREAGPLGECQREVKALEVPLEGPALGHLLAASDARGRYP